MKVDMGKIKNVELANKIVLKEDEKLFRNLHQENKPKFAVNTCAMIGCNLEDGTPTLKEIAEGKECQGKHQAQMLIDNFGFEPEDKLCDSCFWK